MRHRFVAARRPRDDDARILPLINVVFLLLIFFMIAGRLAAGDPFRIEPPRAAQGVAHDPAEPLVLIAADGRLALDGAPLALTGLTQRLRGQSITMVRLKADATGEAVRVVAVMQALHDAGIGKVRLLIVPEPAR